MFSDILKSIEHHFSILCRSNLILLSFVLRQKKKKKLTGNTCNFNFELRLETVNKNLIIVSFLLKLSTYKKFKTKKNLRKYITIKNTYK